MDLEFLPKSMRGPLRAVGAAVVIAAGAIAGYLALEATLVTKATAAAKDSMSELREDVKEIRKDSSYTRCAMIVHMKNGSQAELVACNGK